jgi:hypothetical protein
MKQPYIKYKAKIAAATIKNVTNLCSDKKDVLITHLEALGAMARMFKSKHKDLQEAELVTVMNRIVSGEETSQEKEARKVQQRINFIQACERSRGGRICKLSYAEIFLALQYGADAKMGLQSLNFKVDFNNTSIEEFGGSNMLFNVMEGLIKYGADLKSHVSPISCSHG